MADNNDKFLGALAKHKLFKGLDRAAVERVAASAGARWKKFGRGEVILHKGDRLRSIVVVLSGRVNVIQPTRDGTELLDYTAGAGSVVGMSFLMSRSDPFPSMIQAAASSEVVLLDAGKLRELLKRPENIRLFDNCYQALVSVVIECQQKLSVVGCWEIGDKVLTFFERIAAATGSREIEIPFRTSSEFAQYLGVNRCALSRSISQLVRRGKLKRGDGCYILPAGR